MAKTILYTRVSTMRQAVEGESLGAQLAKLQEWARRESHEVVAVMSDEGLSGGSMNRPGAQAALRLACRMKAQIAVTSLSRWGRSTAEVIESCQTLDRAGAGFISLSEQVSLGHSSGRLVLAILAAVCCWQREVQIESTIMTMAHLRRSHRRIGRHPPYGWDHAPDGLHLTENPVEQAVIADMVTQRSAGRSFESIASELNQRGIMAKLGGEWSGRAVRLVLGRLAKLAAA